MKTAERSHDLDKYINNIISSTKTRWEELKKRVELRSAEARERGDRFESFIDRLTDFTMWLSEFYSSVYEEFLERIPPKASDEIIAHHRTTLRVRKMLFFNISSAGCQNMLTPPLIDFSTPSPLAP
ncbi:MAG: hypothetical protein MJE68_24020 [Proteobacteria bacterium]|nr:hypothetical protein [Pseudomonadota bacterium]